MTDIRQLAHSVLLH